MCTACSGPDTAKLPASTDGGPDATAVKLANAALEKGGVETRLARSDDGTSTQFSMRDSTTIAGALKATGNKDMMALAELINATHDKTKTAQKAASGVSLAGFLAGNTMLDDLVLYGPGIKRTNILSI